MKRVMILTVLALMLSSAVCRSQGTKHTFIMTESEFLLDGQPFQIISGELHPARIPVEYWKHMIQMAKAMGCNTIAAYIFWNYHEPEEGNFDFKTGNHNLQEFFRLVQEEGMWLIVRPGPYVCAEWDFGGLPPYLLRIPDIKIRCMDERYMSAAERYIRRLAEEIKPFMVTKGGPILMLQIENEYGSYGNDRNYMFRLREIWKEAGVDIATFTADGATEYMLEAGSLPGSAVGLNPGSTQADFDLARKMNPGVTVFSAETYPGWLTHWGEKWATRDTADLLKEVRFLMDNKKSFNIYVIHGGTNFGFTAGANSGGNGYEPDVTSYDYDAPINELGQPTSKYMALRRLLSSYLPKGRKLPPIPDSIPVMSIPPISVQAFTSVWDKLPEPVLSVQPEPMEAYGQDYGFILYTTELIGHKSGLLVIKDLHDFATVFLNGNYIGYLDRREGKNSIDLPANNAKTPLLEILVEGMGRINFSEYMIDRKGITDRVTLDGMTLMNWKVYNLPMDKKYIYDLRSSGRQLGKQGIFFRGNFFISRSGDTYLDMTNYIKGVVWVNGHNLGRYWNIGPQKRLYCPESWLFEGPNEIMIFDLFLTQPKPVLGMKTLK